MTHRFTARPRATRRRAALALAGAASALLVFSGSAGATIYQPIDDVEFSQAFADANANPGRDTIVLGEQFYQPGLPIVITDDLTLTGDHSRQGTGAGPTIDGTFVDPPASNTLTVAAGVTADFHGFAIQGASNPPFGAIRVDGTLRVHGMTLSGISGTGIVVGNSGNLSLTNSTISENSSLGLNVAGGTTTITNSNITLSQGGGIAGPGILHLRNTVIANNGSAGIQCFRKATTSIGSFDSGTAAADQCGVGTDPSRHGNPNNGGLNVFGGPTYTQQPFPGSPLIDGGDNSVCATTDQRFFVRPVGVCDIGSFEVGATQDTTLPTCVVTRTQYPPAIPVAQQDVTVRDGQSGIGQDAVRLGDETTITNGTIALTPFASPFRSPAAATPPSNDGLVLTATKGPDPTPGSTQWSFTARDWAGNVRNCS